MKHLFKLSGYYNHLHGLIFELKERMNSRQDRPVMLRVYIIVYWNIYDIYVTTNTVSLIKDILKRAYARFVVSLIRRKTRHCLLREFARIKASAL